jgi:hypothetical protein
MPQRCSSMSDIFAEGACIKTIFDAYFADGPFYLLLDKDRNACACAVRTMLIVPTMCMLIAASRVCPGIHTYSWCQRRAIDQFIANEPQVRLNAIYGGGAHASVGNGSCRGGVEKRFPDDFGER